MSVAPLALSNVLQRFDYLTGPLRDGVTDALNQLASGRMNNVVPGETPTVLVTPYVRMVTFKDYAKKVQYSEVGYPISMVESYLEMTLPAV